MLNSALLRPKLTAITVESTSLTVKAPVGTAKNSLLCRKLAGNAPFSNKTSAKPVSACKNANCFRCESTLVGEA